MDKIIRRPASEIRPVIMREMHNVPDARFRVSFMSGGKIRCTSDFALRADAMQAAAWWERSTHGTSLIQSIERRSNVD